jgi:uncharacterized RmlC-like cupin family protein
MATCVVNSTDQQYLAKQGYAYHSGISAKTAGAKGICMHLLTIPPGGQEKAHLHKDHETSIYIMAGRAEMFYGDELSERLSVKAGDFLYIPPNTPHLPFNPSLDEPCTAVISRTDAAEQESVVLLPELEQRHAVALEGR